MYYEPTIVVGAAAATGSIFAPTVQLHQTSTRALCCQAVLVGAQLGGRGDPGDVAQPVAHVPRGATLRQRPPLAQSLLLPHRSQVRRRLRRRHGLACVREVWLKVCTVPVVAPAYHEDITLCGLVHKMIFAPAASTYFKVA